MNINLKKIGKIYAIVQLAISLVLVFVSIIELFTYRVPNFAEVIRTMLTGVVLALASCLKLMLLIEATDHLANIDEKLNGKKNPTNQTLYQGQYAKPYVQPMQTFTQQTQNHVVPDIKQISHPIHMQNINNNEWKCSQCGTDNSNDAMYCTKCGTHK